MTNPKDNQAWDRLTRAARNAGPEEEPVMPYGFATRVVARAFAQEEVSISALFSRLSLRALLVAGVLAVASLALNYSAIAGSASSSNDVPMDDDPVSILLSL